MKRCIGEKSRGTYDVTNCLKKGRGERTGSSFLEMPSTDSGSRRKGGDYASWCAPGKSPEKLITAKNFLR